MGWDETYEGEQRDETGSDRRRKSSGVRHERPRSSSVVERIRRLFKLANEGTADGELCFASTVGWFCY